MRFEKAVTEKAVFLKKKVAKVKLMESSGRSFDLMTGSSSMIF